MNKRGSPHSEQRSSRHGHFTSQRFSCSSPTTCEENVEEAQAEHSNQQQCCRYADDGKQREEYRLRDLFFGARNFMRNVKANAREHRETETARGDQKPRKESVVPGAHAVIYKGTVVIEPHDAVVAVPTVRRPWWPDDLARRAPPKSHLVLLLREHADRFRSDRVHVQGRRPGRFGHLLLEPIDHSLERVPRDDARVRTRGQQHEHHSCGEDAGRQHRQQTIHVMPQILAAEHEVEYGRDDDERPSTTVVPEVDLRSCNTPTTAKKLVPPSDLMPHLIDPRVVSDR
mmetsp:Transcript_28626/g.75494  ORF Transcript_28626/g.75494 Transcript_28626/m.75494 type:complete len:286 (-) Transcript_28626:237-1094(-)